MKNINIQLTSSVVLLVKIIEKGHTKYKQTIEVETTLEGVLNCGVPDVLITAGVFECLGHPHNHYELRGITVKQPELAHLTEEYKERLRELDPEAYKKYVLGEFSETAINYPSFQQGYDIEITNAAIEENRSHLIPGDAKVSTCKCPAKFPCSKNCGVTKSTPNKIYNGY